MGGFCDTTATCSTNIPFLTYMFLTTSQVVHATSPTPLGPYSVKSTWLEPFAHTPRAWPGPNNSLLIAYVGRQFVPPGGQRNCAAEVRHFPAQSPPF